MTHTETTLQPRSRWTRKAQVLAAVAVPALLGLLLAVRMITTDGQASPAGPTGNAAARAAIKPPAGAVPAPKPFDAKALEFPCWACRESQEWPVRFQTDLDLLAPLGTGTANAAVWYKDFTKQIGSREAEAEAAKTRYIPPVGRLGKALAPDDPLLLEAEPWVDMATMKFYPDIYPFDGPETRIPNLMLAMSLGQSWVARGTASADTAAAMADFRRAIRWGRLLRQDDVTLIADLIGLACIQWGVQGIYDRAVAEGDTGLALLASVTLSEVAPQRLMTSNRVDKVVLNDYVGTGPMGGVKLSVPDERVKEIAKLAMTSSDRRFKFEALISMSLIRYKGTTGQREIVDAAFEKLLTGKDPATQAMARWARDNELNDEAVKSLYMTR